MILIMYAAAGGHLNAVKWLFKKGSLLRVLDSFGYNNTLLVAADYGHINVIEWLLQKGSSLNEGDYQGHNALMYAARSGHLNAVQWLCEHGALIEKKNSMGFTALALAAMRGDIAVVQWLIEQGASQNFKYGNSAFLIAASNDRLPLVQWYLEHGALLEECDQNGKTALLRTSSAPLGSFLLEKGASLRQLPKVDPTDHFRFIPCLLKAFEYNTTVTYLDEDETVMACFSEKERRKLDQIFLRNIRIAQYADKAQKLITDKEACFFTSKKMKDHRWRRYDKLITLIQAENENASQLKMLHMLAIRHHISYFLATGDAKGAADFYQEHPECHNDVTFSDTTWFNIALCLQGNEVNTAEEEALLTQSILNALEQITALSKDGIKLLKYRLALQLEPDQNVPSSSLFWEILFTFTASHPNCLVQFISHLMHEENGLDEEDSNKAIDLLNTVKPDGHHEQLRNLCTALPKPQSPSKTADNTYNFFNNKSMFNTKSSYNPTPQNTNLIPLSHA